jgi:hypothetical protein
MCFNIIFVMSEGTKIQITCRLVFLNSCAAEGVAKTTETDTEADAAAVEAASDATFARAAVEAD